MNIVEKMNQDIANLTVSEEIKLLQQSLKTYMMKLNQLLQSKGSMSFDYYGGCFSSHGYFNFSKDFLIYNDTDKTPITVTLLNSDVDLEFKFHPKTGNLNYWSHVVKSPKAKETLVGLITRINSKIQEIELE